MKIAVDMDEVMVHMLPSLKKHYRKVYKKPHPIQPNYEYDYSKIFKIPPREAQWLVYSFWNSEESYDLKPVKDADTVLRKLKSQGHSLTVVTGRQIYATAATECTINKHFEGLFDDIIYTNSYSLLGPEIGKPEVCERIMADYLIDDSTSQIKSLEHSETIPILFTGKPQYQWTYELPGVLQFSDWNKIQKFYTCY